MKLFNSALAGAACAAAAFTLAPTAFAEPDPHIPDAQAGYCPGGEVSEKGGVRYCLGIPYESGAFYSQSGSFGAAGPFGPWSWGSSKRCSVRTEMGINFGLPYGRLPDCGGGPTVIP